MSDRITIQTTAEIRGAAAAVIGELLGVRPISEEQAYGIRLAIGELLTNSLTHSGCHRAELLYAITDDVLRICIIDDGAGFDHRCAGACPPAACECGRGIFLVRSFADGLRFNKKGNAVSVCIYL